MTSTSSNVRATLVGIAAGLVLAGCNNSSSGDQETTAEATPVATETATPNPALLPANALLTDPGVKDALRAAFPDPNTLFATVSTDLNADGNDEVIVYAYGPTACGSGGCSLLVFKRDASGLHAVTKTTVTQEPIRELATITNGWRDLSVGVGGGGAASRQVRLQYDGKSYPANPTVLPESATVGATDGTVLFEEPLQGAALPAS
jgi:hypothetical protein